MTIHVPSEERLAAATHDSRIKRHPKDLDQAKPGPSMTDTLLELAATIVGFLGVMLLILACVRIMGYAS